MIFLISGSIFKYPAQDRSSCSTLRLLYLMITWTLLLRKIKQSHFTLKWWIYHEFHIFELRDKEINLDRGDHHSYWYARLFTVPYFSVRSKTLRYGRPSWMSVAWVSGVPKGLSFPFSPETPDTQARMSVESWLSGRERFLFDWLQFSTKRACLKTSNLRYTWSSCPDFYFLR